LYAFVIFVTVGVLDLGSLKNNLTPISDGAAVFGGNFLKIVVSVAAFLAFISTANAAIMTASRYPLGMSRDKLLPNIFKRVSAKFKTPYVSVLFTGLFIVLAITFLRLELLVKVASSLLIILFVFANLTVIMFRESNIASYQPRFHSPLYPFIQVFGILSGGFLLIEMGTFIVFLTLTFILLGFIWYRVYARRRANQDSALIHVLEKLVSRDRQLVSDNLLTELKDIVIQRDDIIKDKFHRLVEQAKIIDVDKVMVGEEFFQYISRILAKELNLTQDYLYDKFIEREKAASTVIKKGLAIPHAVVEGEGISKIVLVRSKSGVVFPNDQVVRAIFVLVSSADQRMQHLKILAAIAQICQNTEFNKKWLQARDKDQLRNIVLLAERKRE
jgi:mannitol/fructose-specific phosphotransferase system IIA component (Ntr-type)/uncharacterized membrane protein YesL